MDGQKEKRHSYSILRIKLTTKSSIKNFTKHNKYKKKDRNKCMTKKIRSSMITTNIHTQKKYLIMLKCERKYREI